MKLESCRDNCEKREQLSKRDKLRASIGRFLEQFRIVRRSLVHPRVPWHAKVVASCAVLYVVSPIQVIPNFIPIIGQMDDVAAVVLAIKYLKRHVPQDVLDEFREHSRTRLKRAVKCISSVSDSKANVTKVIDHESALRRQAVPL